MDVRTDHLASSRAKAAAGDAAGAFADAVQAARAAPNDWASQAQLALTAEAVGAGKVGIGAAERWALLAPGDWQAHAALGRLHMARDRAQPARLAFQRAWRLNPYDLDVYTNLTLLEAILGGRHRRGALERVEQLVADGHLEPHATPAVVDAAVRVASRWLAIAAAYLTLLYVVFVAVHADERWIDADTVARPLVASGVVAAVLLWWFVPMWRRLTPAGRRLVPGMLRREPLDAIELSGHALALLILLVVPAVWYTGARTATLVVAGVAFGLSLFTEVVTSGVALGRGTGVRDLIRLVLQPPYIIGTVIFVAAVAWTVRGVAAVLRALGRAIARRPTR